VLLKYCLICNHASVVMKRASAALSFSTAAKWEPGHCALAPALAPSADTAAISKM
jgi:hypothetical protein